MRYGALIFIVVVVALFAVTACAKKEVVPVDVGGAGGSGGNTQAPATIDNQETGVVAENDDITVGDII